MKLSKNYFIVVFTLLLTIIISGCSSQGPNSKKETVTFDDNMFFNGTILVKNDNHCSLLDKQGKELASFLDISFYYSDGLLAFKDNGKYGYMDLTGKVIIPALYDNINPFTGGLGGVRLNGYWGFVDKTNKMIIAPQFDSIGIFNNGLCNVSKDGVEYYIDTKGKKAFEKDFLNADSFISNVAVVETEKGYSLINTSGAIITETFFDNIFIDDIKTWLETGLIIAELGDKKGYISGITGETIIFPTYNQVSVFNEGVCTVINGDKYGAMDATGKIILAPIYDYVGKCSDGLCDYVENGKLGFIDKKGNIVIKPTYDTNDIKDISAFENGIAAIENYEGVTLYIDKTGKEINKPKLKNDYLQPFYEQGWGFQDINGETVIENKYSKYSIISTTKYAVYSDTNDTWSLLDRKGDELSSFNHVEIMERRVYDSENIYIKTQLNKSKYDDRSTILFTDDGYAFIGSREQAETSTSETSSSTAKACKGIVNLNGEIVFEQIYDEITPIFNMDAYKTLMER